MIIGMGITFLFLGILILSIMGASKLIWKFFPEPEEPTAPSRVSPAETEIAIAVAAVTARTHK